VLKALRRKAPQKRHHWSNINVGSWLLSRKYAFPRLTRH